MSALSPFQKEFHIFEVVYQELSISRASEALSLDQGNVSRSLKNLEEKIGVKLFARHRNGVHPTPAADELQTGLKEINKLWDGLKKGNFSTTNLKTIRIGGHSSIAHTYFGNLIRCLYTKFENAYIDIQLDTSYHITRKVQRREIEIGIVANPIKSEDLLIKTLALETAVLCGAKSQICDNSVLLRNPQMLFIEKLQKSIRFKRIIDILDYDVSASICTKNDNFYCIIPSAVAKRYRTLKVLSNLKGGIQIKLITYPGSPVVGLMNSLVKSIGQ